MKDVEILTAKYKQAIFDCDWATLVACSKELDELGVEIPIGSTLPTLLPKIGIDEVGEMLLDFPVMADGKTPIYFIFPPDDEENVYIGFFPFTLEEAEKNNKEYMDAIGEED